MIRAVTYWSRLEQQDLEFWLTSVVSVVDNQKAKWFNKISDSLIPENPQVFTIFLEIVASEIKSLKLVIKSC